MQNKCEKQAILFEIGFEIIGSQEQIPAALSPRGENAAILTTSLLAFSFFIIALARLSSRQMVAGMVRAVYKNKQIEKIVQEEYPLKNLSSFFLVLNYLISASALLFLCISSSAPKTQPWIILLLAPIPFLVFFLPWLSLVLAGAITGEKDIVEESKLNTMVFAHFAGLVYSLILLVWTFNGQWSPIFIRIFIGVSVFIWLYRFLRGFIFAFSKGAPWYYIILYFCTLEILPFVLCYLVLNFKMEGKFDWLLN